MTPYIAQIALNAFSFPPKGWALAQGQLLSIQQNAALFSILGTFYGGNGVNNFGLPDLRGRTGVHQGQGLGLSSYTVGQVGGSQNVTLLANNLPLHIHSFNANNTAATTASPSGASPSVGQANITCMLYSTAASDVQMAASSLANAGSNLPMSILQPYLCLNYSIALTGIFPSRN